jgi:ferric-dicitrate binding protein FerR (iron transport regulator)
MSDINKQRWISRFLSRELSQEEHQRFDHERSENPPFDRRTRETEKLWELARLYKSTQPTDASGAWAAFEAKTNLKHKPARRVSLLRIAASVLLVLGLAMGWYMFLRPLQVTLMAQTSAGEQLELPLPDGSVIWLNELSTLHCLNCHTRFSRKLRLSGEAYFQVAQDAERPFKVHGGQTQVEVLGTQFNFRCYPLEPIEEVEVNSGRVRVSNPSAEPVTLEAKQRIRYSPNNETIGPEPSPHYNGSAWKHRKLNFHGESVAEAIQYMERFHSTTITIEVGQMRLDTCLFTAQYEKTTSIEAMIAVLLTQFEFQLATTSHEGKKAYILRNFRCK